MKETETKNIKDAFQQKQKCTSVCLDSDIPRDDQGEEIPVYIQSPPHKLKDPRKKVQPQGIRYADVPFDMIE